MPAPSGLPAVRPLPWPHGPMALAPWPHAPLFYRLSMAIWLMPWSHIWLHAPGPSPMLGSMPPAPLFEKLTLKGPSACPPPPPFPPFPAHGPLKGLHGHSPMVPRLHAPWPTPGPMLLHLIQELASRPAIAHGPMASSVASCLPLEAHTANQAQSHARAWPSAHWPHGPWSMACPPPQPFPPFAHGSWPHRPVVPWLHAPWPTPGPMLLSSMSWLRACKGPSPSRPFRPPWLMAPYGPMAPCSLIPCPSACPPPPPFPPFPPFPRFPPFPPAPPHGPIPEGAFGVLETTTRFLSKAKSSKETPI